MPTRDRPALLAQCLATVEPSLRPGDELIVADSSSGADAVAAIVAQRGGQLIRCQRPGASHQRNAGAARARHEIVAFVDDDVRVAPGWAGSLAEAFAAHPEAAFITGRLEVPPEQTGYARAVSTKSEQDPAPLTSSTRGTLGHSANMAVRRSAFDHVGGFDERLGPGAPFRAAEDGDLMDRLFAAGYEGRYEPDALGWHEQWRSRTDLVRLEWAYGVGVGARLTKLARVDRERARVIAREYLWRNALRGLPRLVRQRSEFGVMYVVARVSGASVGAVRATLARFGTSPPPGRR